MVEADGLATHQGGGGGEGGNKERRKGKSGGGDGRIMMPAGRTILRFTLAETKSTVNFYGDSI